MSDEIARIQQAQIHAQQIASLTARAGIKQEESEDFQQFVDDSVFNPMAIARRFEQLEMKARRQARKEEAEKSERSEEEQVLAIQSLDAVSEQFQRKNPELLSRSLLLLRARIKAQDSKEEILRKVLEMYPDYSLADEAIDFLLQTTSGDLAVQVRLAKELLNETYGREVRAGRNIAAQAREFSSKGLGTPTGLRDLYRDVTGNPRDTYTLFNEFTSKFEYKQMKVLFDFLLHSLGSDLKAKGSSIDHAELYRLLTETRRLQAILGIFRFFDSRMALIGAAFARQGIILSPRITFESLAKLFMKFLQERYPSMEKILQMAAQLGISEELLGQIIIFTQMRDAVRGIAPKLYRSEQHRQDVLKSFIDAIENLDDQLDEDEEKEENKEKS